MKKLLTVLLAGFLIFFGFLLTGCTEENSQDNIDLMVNIAETLTLENEDTVWDTSYMNNSSYLGSAKLLMIDDTRISLVLFDKNGYECLYVSVYLDESTSLKTGIYEFDITYINFEDNIYVELWYYHWGELINSNYDTEYFNIKQVDLQDSLMSLDISDWKTILIELGYNVGD